jgi:hypothetical protein
MGASKTRDLPAGLEGVRQRFERWRQSHRTRSRIPDSLWAAAARVAFRCGLHRTSRALRLDYYSLKERVEQQSNATRDPAERVTADQRRPCKHGARSAPAFLELAPLADHGLTAASTGPCECTLELENATGAKLRVHLKNIVTPDLAALSRSFWNPGP